MRIDKWFCWRIKGKPNDIRVRDKKGIFALFHEKFVYFFEAHVNRLLNTIDILKLKLNLHLIVFYLTETENALQLFADHIHGILVIIHNLNWVFFEILISLSFRLNGLQTIEQEH